MEIREKYVENEGHLLLLVLKKYVDNMKKNEGIYEKYKRNE